MVSTDDMAARHRLSLLPDAAGLVAILPTSVDQVWTTVYGPKFFAVELLTLNGTTAELHRTQKDSTVRGVRERRQGVLEKRQQGLSVTLVGALVDQAHGQYPKASPAQLLVIARGAFRDLLSGASPISAAHSSASSPFQSAD